jgi:hypothetical protein
MVGEVLELPATVNSVLIEFVNATKNALGDAAAL